MNLLKTNGVKITRYLKRAPKILVNPIFGAQKEKVSSPSHLSAIGCYSISINGSEFIRRVDAIFNFSNQKYIGNQLIRIDRKS